MVHNALSNKPGKRVVQRAFHIQNVNALHSRYDEFMHPFKGPASKYLEHYLHWLLLRKLMEPEEIFRKMFSA